jgi:hypothetical protein
MGDNVVFFFDKNLLPLPIVGLFFVLATFVLIVLRKINPRSFSGIVQILMGVSFGIWIFYGYFSMCRNDKNIIDLLEQGRLAEAKVLRVWLSESRGYPWAVSYSFEVPDSRDGKLIKYEGTSKAHLPYYKLSNRNSVTVIYNPDRPEFDFEINEFLNDYTGLFEQAGKQQQLDNFRDIHKDEFKNYRLLQWDEHSRRR